MTSTPAPERRLRIAVLNRSFSPTAGGAERYSIALVEQLAARHDVHVFAQNIAHSWPGVTYHRVSMPMRKPRWINQLWFAAAAWWATRSGFDIVHSHENSWHGDVQTVHVLPIRHTLFAGRAGWRLASRCLKVATSPRLLAYLWLERMRYAVRPAKAVVVISETLGQFFAATYPSAAGMVSMITPGINLPAEVVSRDERIAARRLLGIPQDRPCVLFVGNDFRKKGLHVLLDAMKLMDSDVMLAVVGHSAQRPVFLREAEERGLQDRVLFLGAMTDVGPAYRAADCLAHPTLEDTFAMVVLEAMANGIPVLVSSAEFCGISGMLDDGVNALILDDPRHAGAVASMLRRLLSDATLRAKLAANGRAFAKTFEWEKLASRQEQLYHDLIAKKEK